MFKNAIKKCKSCFLHRQKIITLGNKKNLLPGTRKSIFFIGIEHEYVLTLLFLTVDCFIQGITA